MRKWAGLVILAMSTASFCGCAFVIGRDGRNGRAGRPGRAFITYTWLYGSITYSTDDPGISANIVLSGQYYATEPGEYEFSYTAWNASFWEGEYTIYINEGELGEQGEAGALFQDGRDGEDGEDGEDIYFELLCFSIGPSFYEWDSPDDLVTVDVRRAAMYNKEAGRPGTPEWAPAGAREQPPTPSAAAE